MDNDNNKPEWIGFVQELSWHNYDTGEYDYYPHGNIPDDLMPYLPNEAPVRNMYLCFLELGYDKIEAYKETLDRYTDK